MTEEQEITQRKERLMEKYSHLTEQDAEMYVMVSKNMGKPENRKDVPEISPELEAQLLALVGR
jgi:hypothetical protein